MGNKRYASLESRRSLARGIISGLEQVPGVEGVGVCTKFPATVGGYAQISFVGKQTEADIRPRVYWGAVSPGFFKAVGARLLKGRFLIDNDNENSKPVVVINRQYGAQALSERGPAG